MTLRDYILDEVFSSITSFGSPVFYILVILILFRFDFSFALTLIFALVFVELFCIFIKLIYRKDRPTPQSRKEFFNKIDANSFPSVHSARISLIVTLFSFHYKYALIYTIGAIVMLGVGYSRIYLKRHYFNDVLVGFFIGIITAVIAIYL